MLRHLHGGRDQLRLRREPIEKAHLIEPLGSEAEAQGHLHGNRIGHVGEMTMMVAAEQPALSLRYLEYRSWHGDAKVGSFHQHETATHRKPVDGGDHRLLELALEEGIGKRWTCATRSSGRQRFL